MDANHPYGCRKENNMKKKVQCMTHSEFQMMLADMKEHYQVVSYRYSYENAYAEFVYYDKEPEYTFDIPKMIQTQHKVRLNLGSKS